MRSALFAVCSLFFVIPAAAQTTTDLVQTGNGARAVGLGYAFTAIADDATAMSWNPAGMAQLLFPEASIVVNSRAMLPRLDVKDQDLDSYSGAASFSVSPINFASFVYPLATRHGTAVFGASYRDVYDWRRSFTYTREYSAGSQYATVVDGFDRTGGITAFSVAGAFAPSQRLMFGVSANFLRGRTDSELRFDITGNTNQNTSQSLRGSTADYDGTAVELGALARPLDWLTLGVHYALPYERTSSNLDENEIELNRSTLHVPRFMSFGVAFALDESNRLAFDVKQQAWSNAYLTNAENGARISSAERHDMKSYHFGYEHIASRATHLQSYRLGAFTRPVIFADVDDNTITGYGGAVGTGWAYSRVAIDVALSYLYFEPHARWPSTTSKWSKVQDNELLFTAGFIYYF